ncbi:hypothetical protein [Chryseobacterium rhizosphaerae]|uniref:Uncharacterized protein n=1 Tax=Chryseobacterium rhizosphaerae TaxID=395937 RepID=A0ABX9IGZ4_9FLAO|nr:hypothetical protein [Chryseobacterium rhizosphaerae]REC73501.1 hypothetical protein DRF57_17510 [Chryseobacterium rhizosphaerae]GEN68602.1 hypothetical protein CRH01_31700 [Chryseobacterium rhizosphaerae]
MKSKQTMFFTVFEDIEQILRDIETTVDICYYYDAPLLLDTKNIPVYDSIFDTPNVGTAQSAFWLTNYSYLVMKKDILLNINEIPQRKGGMKYDIDQVINPQSIELKLGGIYTEKEHVIIAGRVATISQANDSLELYKLFSSKIKKEFKKIGMFYVGSEAEKKLREGWRLVQDEGFSKEYDLTLKG